MQQVQAFIYGTVTVQIMIHIQTSLKGKTGWLRHVYYHLQVKKHYSDSDKELQNTTICTTTRNRSIKCHFNSLSE
jgi:hypothetical protein